MKIVTIAVIAILLMAAGGAGGYFYFHQQAVASYGETGADILAKKKAEKEAALSAEEKAKNLRFVEMTPIILPIIDADGVSQVVTLVISLEVEGEENAKYTEQLIPRLKDAYIQDMYGVLNRKASMEGGVLKVDDLKERLFRLSAEVLGEDKINEVLLQVVNQRPV